MTAKVKSGRLASLCGLLIIWPLIVVVAILVKVKMPGRRYEGCLRFAGVFVDLQDKYLNG